MIVRADGSSLLLITQPDHAALAGRIMVEWRAGGLPDAPRRRDILLAVDQHDNGWQEADATPIVDDAGRILDFITAPDGVRRGAWPRGVERLAASPYAAALVAQHALHIYRRYRADPEWVSFFIEMAARRTDQLRKAAPVTLDDVTRDYSFLRIGDLVSLTFCTGRPQAEDPQAQYAIRLDGMRMTITPDPFEGREVPLEITARALPNRPFHSVADANQAFSTARQVMLRGVASGGLSTSS